MTTQQQFDFSPPTNGTPTSIEAAASVSDRVTQMQAAVLAELKRRGEHGATRDELAESLGLNPNTLRPRVWELVHAGRVVDTAERRKTATGRNASVLRAQV